MKEPGCSLVRKDGGSGGSGQGGGGGVRKDKSQHLYFGSFFIAN